MDIQKRFMSVAAKTLDVPVDEIRSDTDLGKAFDVDSIGVIELILATEEEFEIDISDEEVEHIRTVQQAIDYVTARIKKAVAVSENSGE